METLVSLAVGLGLAAACGFRVFVPLLALSLAARSGSVPLSAGFDWVASDAAMVAFGSATVLEVIAYYIPWLDHALDVVATPAAIAAGVVTSASVFADLPPVLRWTAALVGGGGMAALIQGSTVALRAGSTAATAGMGNGVVATGELAGSMIISLLALVLPFVAVVVALAFAWIVFRVARRILRRSPPPVKAWESSASDRP